MSRDKHGNHGHHHDDADQPTGAPTRHDGTRAATSTQHNNEDDGESTDIQ